MNIKLMLVLVVAFVFGGCKNITKQEAFLGRVENAAFTASGFYLLSNPNKRPVFEQTVKELSLLMTSTKATQADLHEIMTHLPIKELHGTSMGIIVRSVQMEFQNYGKTVDLSKAEYLHPVVQAIRDGLDAGLNTTEKNP